MSYLHPAKHQRRILWIVLLFVVLGEIMLFSATGILGLQKHGSEFYFVYRQSVSAVLGLCLMLLLSQVPYSFLGKISVFLLVGQIILVAATHLSPFAQQALGANRWLRIGAFQFQPSEFAKITVAIYLARLLAGHKTKALTVAQWVIYCTPLVVLLYLIHSQPDLGTTVILCTIIFGLLFVAGLRPLYVMSLLGTGTGLFIFSLLSSDYRRRRLFAFLNPWADPQGSGFQSIQSFLSFHSGKIFGLGMGNGNSKLFFLPEVHTDFIFSLIGEELGFMGTIIILLLFLYFGYLLFKIPTRIPDAFGSYLSFALSLVLMIQVTINLAGVTGLIPIKGLPLPFFSWGRTALMGNFVMIGILLNILKHSEIIPPGVQQKPSGR